MHRPEDEHTITTVPVRGTARTAPATRSTARWPSSCLSGTHSPFRYSRYPEVTSRAREELSSSLIEYIGSRSSSCSDLFEPVSGDAGLDCACPTRMIGLPNRSLKRTQNTLETSIRTTIPARIAKIIRTILGNTLSVCPFSYTAPSQRNNSKRAAGGAAAARRISRLRMRRRIRRTLMGSERVLRLSVSSDHRMRVRLDHQIHILLPWGYKRRSSVRERRTANGTSDWLPVARITRTGAVTSGVQSRTGCQRNLSENRRTLIWE